MTTLAVRGKQAGSDKVWLRISAFLSLKSPATQITYSGIISEWCRFLRAEPGSAEAAIAILSATDLHAIAYRRFLENKPGERPRMARGSNKNSTERGLTKERYSGRSAKKDGLEATQSNATIHKKFAALRRIYRVLVASNLGLSENPFEADRVPPPPKDAGRKRPTEMIDFDLVMEIVSSPDPGTPKGRRDRALLATLFGAGLRRSEVVALRVGDVRRTPSGTTFLYLRHTKAKKDAQQGLPAWAAEHVAALIKERKQSGAHDSDYLFLGFTGKGGKTVSTKPISDTGLYLLFKHYCAAAGAGAFATPHSARATAITKLLADGIPHRQVQEFSRHSSIQMVEWYDKRRFGVEDSPAKSLEYSTRKKRG
jgi:integrase